MLSEKTYILIFVPRTVETVGWIKHLVKLDFVEQECLRC